MKRTFGSMVCIAALAIGASGSVQGQASAMTFFVTSVGSGKGADFGGIERADKHCQALATGAAARASSTALP